MRFALGTFISYLLPLSCMQQTILLCSGLKLRPLIISHAFRGWLSNYANLAWAQMMCAGLAHVSATRWKACWGWLISDGLRWDDSFAPRGVSFPSRLGQDCSHGKGRGTRERVEVF